MGSGPIGKIFNPIAKMMGLSPRTNIQAMTKASEDVVKESAEELAKKKKAALAQQSGTYGTAGGALGQEYSGGKTGRSNIFGN